jgi:hypothetical protein
MNDIPESLVINEPSFERELSQLVNKHSKDADANTPDFILAEYIKESLELFRRAVKARDHWRRKDG